MVGDEGTKVLFYLRYVPIYRCPNCGNEQASRDALTDIEGQADEILDYMGIERK
jgi:hypothetical protein